MFRILFQLAVDTRKKFKVDVNGVGFLVLHKTQGESDGKVGLDGNHKDEK